MSDPPGPREFATTHWSLVAAASADEASQTRARMALEELCRAYWQPLYAFVRHRGYSPDDARDVTQIVFSNAFKNLGRFDFRHRFHSWIHRITINESIKLLDRRRPSRSIDPDIPSDAPTPEERADASETCEVRSLRYLP